MYITTIVPTKENHSVEIPEEFYGKEVIVEVKKLLRKQNLIKSRGWGNRWKAIG